MKELNQPVEAIIFVGGLGSRMGELTATRQKCLLPIDGRPILGHILDGLSISFPSTRVTLCVAYLEDDVRQYVAEYAPPNISCDYVRDDGRVPYTAALLRGVEGRTSGPFLAVAGDVVVEPHLYSTIYNKIIESGALACMAMSRNIEEAATHAAISVTGESVTKIEYPPPADLGPDHYRDMTAWALDPGIYTYMREYPGLPAIPSVLGAAIALGQDVRAHVYEGRWVNVSYAEDLQKSMQSAD
jgi:NDP-sugar pyrophosphorylase family protein